MKRSHILPLLVSALVAGGCASEEADTSPSPEAATPAATAESRTFDFRGDFKGPLGLQLWSVRESMEKDVPGTLARVRAMGFQEVELAGTAGMTPQQFRQELDRAGLDATAMHAPYERLRDSLDVVLAEAKTLGAENVGVAWVPHPEGQPFDEALARRTAADFNAWGKAAREQGLTFFYHNHGYEFRPIGGGETAFDVLARETDPENVKFEMDVFWVAHPGVDPAALLRKYPGRWKLMHIKDMKQGTPTGDFSGHAPAEANVPVGTGQIDYRKVLQAAQEVGVERFYIEDESTDPLNNIPKSIEFLETVRF